MGVEEQVLPADGGVQRVAHLAAYEGAGGQRFFLCESVCVGEQAVEELVEGEAGYDYYSVCFGLELEMQVELLKRDKNDKIDTPEQCMAATWEIHGEPHVPRQVVQNF